jgi:hypothetical protein
MRARLMVVGGFLAAAACSPGPLSSPHGGVSSTSPRGLGNDAPTGNIEAARRQLEGTWTLVSLEAVPESGGQRAPITASGTLVYDAFGNLTIDAHTTDPDAPVAMREVSIVSFQGRAVVDVPHSELQMMALTGNVDPNEALSPERRRRYAFEGDHLKLTSFDASGTIASISVWVRRP